MKILNNLFDKLDHFTKSQAMDLKTQPQYNTLISSIDLLEEPIPKILYHGFNYFIIAIPLILSLFLLISNNRKRNSLKLKKEIITKILTLEKQNTKYNQYKRNFLVSSPTSTKENLKIKLSSVLNTIGISFQNVEIKEFLRTKVDDEIKRIKVLLIFKKFTAKDFSKFSSRLTNNENITFTKINISKENATQTIYGELNFTYLSE